MHIITKQEKCMILKLHCILTKGCIVKFNTIVQHPINCL